MTISCIVVRPESSDKNPMLGGGAVVEEDCYVIKGDSLQIRREGDDANLIF
jgi:hypothetical protein